VDTTVAALFQDDALFDSLAGALEADLLADLATYDIQDPATLESYFDGLADLALHRGDYDGAAAFKDSIRALDDAPGPRMVAGIIERPLAEARLAPADRFQDTFRESFRREVTALPFDDVRAELTGIKGNLEIASDNSIRGFLMQLEPAAASGELSREVAQLLVKMRTFDRLAPVRDAAIEILGETIAAHEAARPDIWADLDVSLEGRDDVTPVTIAVWDSGVDVDLFRNQLYTNTAEVPDNGRDDDDNGHVDDVHGIAYDLEHRRTTGVLYPLTLTPAEVVEYRGYLKGQSDLQAGVDSPEAEAFRRKAATTPPAEFLAWMDGIGQVGEYVHGTLVADVATRDNPAARVLVARRTWDPGAVPQPPTVESARRRAREFQETVAYFQHHGVRVVNMSWGFFALEIESALEASGAGGTPEERQRLARQIFEIEADALRSAIESAAEILFVASVINADVDTRFVEDAPSSFETPNLLSVAVVDRAGDEASFTSYGKVDIWAHGVGVPTRTPGGEVVPMSGASIATPQVVNLAAKLLALRPQLSVAELRSAIVEPADERVTPEGRTLLLLNPKASVERVVGR
jgi:hypothetical protein